MELLKEKIIELLPNILTITTCGLNMDNETVQQESYVIAIIILIYSIFLISITFITKGYNGTVKDFKENHDYDMFLFVSCFMNIIYSIATIHYYTAKKPMDLALRDLSVTVITLEVLNTIYILLGRHKNKSK